MFFSTNIMFPKQFKTPYVGYVEDSYAYDLQSLVGEVGGTLGMFLGASFLSLAELALGVGRRVVGN